MVENCADSTKLQLYIRNLHKYHFQRDTVLFTYNAFTKILPSNCKSLHEANLKVVQKYIRSIHLIFIISLDKT